MKVTKQNRVKMEPGELRFGNFFIKEERDHIRIQDISSLMSHRINKDIVIGVYLRAAIAAYRSADEAESKGAEIALHNYCALLFEFSCVVPVRRTKDKDGEDYDFALNILEECNRCVDKVAALYGISNVTEEEDAAIVAEQKALHEDFDAVRRDADEGKD